MIALGEPDNCTCGRTVSGGFSCPEHPKAFVPFADPLELKPEIPEISDIPEGMYCYTGTGRVKIQNKMFDYDGEVMTTTYYFAPETKTCPYWNRVEEGDAYCSHMKVRSEHQDPGNLIWDQVKECEENPGEPYNLFELEEMKTTTPAYVTASKHLKKYPEFLQSLVAILLDSETNELVYDGVAYTLSQTIIDEIG
jgi:hypothetical protein